MVHPPPWNPSQQAPAASAGDLARAVQAAHLGCFEWDILQNRVRRLFSSEPDLPAGEDLGTLESMADRVIPEDRSLFLANVQAALAHPDGTFETEFRFRRSDGSIVWLQERGRVDRDASGRPVRLVGVSQDITDRIGFERRLLDSESTLRSFYESCPLMIGVVEVTADDSDVVILSCNQATERFYSLPPGHILRRSASALGFTPASLRLWVGHYRRSQDLGEPVRFEYRQDDLPRAPWISAVVSCIGPAREGTTRFSFVAEDISERKQAERRIAEQARMLDISGDAIICRDSGDCVVYWNEGARRLYGYTAAEAEGRNLHELLQSTNSEPMLMLNARARAAGSWEGELMHRRKDGTTLVVLSRWVVDHGNGREGFILESDTDITERKRIEAGLRASEEKFRAVFEHAATGIAIANLQGGLLEWNPALLRILRRPSADMVRFRITDLVHPEDRAENLRRLDRLVEGGIDSFELEDRCVGPDGSTIWVRKVFSLIRDSNRRAARIIALFHEVTEQRATLEALQRAQVELERHAGRLETTVEQRTAKLRETISELEHFSYTITHDMRAPLRAMQSFGEILQQDYAARLDEQGRNYVGRIVRAAARMDRLITDALDYSKAVQAELRLEPVEPGLLLTGILESYPQLQPPAAEILLEEPFPAVLANEAGLTQCLSNLLTNAVKFVPPGTLPRVRIWAERRGAEVRIWVEDNGVGIDPAQRDRVFHLFQRLDRRFEGTGVGLALVRKVAHRMRGRVGFEPGSSRGTRFWIEFSAAEGKSP